MDIIVDIQGFKIPNNEFVLKELATVSIQRNPEGGNTCPKSGCYLFAPPSNWNSLPAKYKCMNSWLSRNFHGLSWNIGEYPYGEIKAILHNITKDKGYVYVKGLEKKQWIENIIEHSKPVINLEELNCPSLRTLQNSCNCQYHNMISKYTCAFENVQALKNWFLELSGIAIPSLKRSISLYCLLNDGIKAMVTEDIVQLPKNFLMIFESNELDKIWDKLPKELQQDKEIINLCKCRKNVIKN